MRRTGRKFAIIPTRTPPQCMRHFVLVYALFSTTGVGGNHMKITNKESGKGRGGKREREQHCKSWKCRFSSLVDFSNFPDLGNLYEKSQNSDLVALSPSELFLLRSCVLWHSLSHYPRSLSFSLFLEQALLIPYSSSLCVFRFPVKTLRRQ